MRHMNLLVFISLFLLLIILMAKIMIVIDASKNFSWNVAFISWIWVVLLWISPTLMTDLFFGNFWVFWEKAFLRSLIIPNRSLDRKNAIGNENPYFLSSFIFLLASCFSFVFAVACYTFKPTINHLLNNLMKAVQNLMTDLGLRTTMIIRICSDWGYGCVYWSGFCRESRDER